MSPAGSSPRSENSAEGNIALRHIVESPQLIGAGNGTVLPRCLLNKIRQRSSGGDVAYERRGSADRGVKILPIVARQSANAR
jgi:hypothetical protein